MTRSLAEWEAVVRGNPVNGTYQDALATARFEAGDYAGALSAWQDALRLGAWAHLTALDALPTVYPGEIGYRIACCHARLGDRERAMDALGTAIGAGLRDARRALTDEHLSALHGDARLADLVGPADGAGLSRVDGWWTDLRLLHREIEHRAPKPHRPGLDAAVAELHDAVPNLTDIQIVVELWRLLRNFADGHAYIDVASVYPEWTYALPVWFYQFVEGLFVTDADARYRALLGAQVLAVDGHDVPAVLAALDSVITRDNEYWPAGIAPRWLRQPAILHALGVAEEPGRVTLTVRQPDATVVDVTVNAEQADHPMWQRFAPPDALAYVDTLPGKVPAYLRDRGTRYWFEHQPADDLVYFQFNGIGDLPDEPLDAFYRRLFAYVDEHGVSRLVMDLRWNGGGDTFLAVPLVHHVIRHDHLDLYVVIGRHTFSAAQNLATMLELHVDPVFVGEPTGGRPNGVGERVEFELPYSRLKANIGDLYWQTSWPFDQRPAIAPHLYAPPTFEAFRAQRDPAMEAILRELA